MATNVGSIEITWKMPGGVPGVDQDPTNPWARALRMLFTVGQPLPRFSKCFFKDRLGALRWLGVFVFSAGQRIIFFPALTVEVDAVITPRDGIAGEPQSFAFDHVSLEKDRATWHATSTNGEHIAGPRTLPLGDGRLFWFGFSIADASILPLVYENTVVKFPTPLADAERRFNEFKKSRDEAVFTTIMLNEELHSLKIDGFLHFWTVIGPHGFDDYVGPELSLPGDSPFFTAPLPARQESIASRLHRIELTDQIDIQVTACELPGKMIIPAAFSGK